MPSGSSGTSLLREQRIFHGLRRVILMDFETVVKKWRMCREYSDEDVPQEKVDRILDMASRYPSAGHTEPQEFLVVRDQRVKEDLAHVALD
jgi:nitroreductase